MHGLFRKMSISCLSTNSVILRNLVTNKFAVQMGNYNQKTVSQLVELISGFKVYSRADLRSGI